jgi:hypothetical protein
MDTQQLLQEVKAEIARLQKVADLLEEGSTSTSGRRKRKPMSQEARAKIAAAQKKRWAKTKKSD